MNLCTNAAHAIEKNGGELFVSLREIELETGGEDGLDLPPGPYLILRVKDTGTGMPPYVVERIFEPFFTTKEKGRGTGMGLAVVHGIVKSHGGDILVETAPGKGTVFDVYLPVIQRSPDPVPEPGRESVRGGSEHVLMVDDEIMLVDVAKSRLNALGYRVTIETDSTQALALFKENPRDFDLVITDLSMPVMSGDKMALEMMALRPDLPVILCTGFNSEMTEETALNLGFKEYLMKPLGFNDMALAVRQVLDGPSLD